MQSRIAPSILSADFSKLGQEIAEVEAAGADWIHVDVMDGHFVPNLTLGPPIVASIRNVTRLPLDCHLMVAEPEKWIEPFLKSGADCITVHIEAAKDLPGIFKKIRAQKKLVGISLSPDTPVSKIKSLLPEVDLVLVMSVHPGFGGQSFLESAFDKIREISELGRDDLLIEVDGGVGPTNIGDLRLAGANVFVAGSAIFSAKDRKASVKVLRDKLSEAERS